MKKAILLLALAWSGCGHSFEAATPTGFVELEEEQEPYDYRATTADGLVLGVTEVDHEPEGNLEFWSRAIENRMRQRGGYALLGKGVVKNRDGVTGHQLRFGHDQSGKPHLYNVTIFLTESTIYILEAGGTKELMTRHKQQLDWSVQNFRIK